MASMHPSIYLIMPRLLRNGNISQKLHKVIHNTLLSKRPETKLKLFTQSFATNYVNSTKIKAKLSYKQAGVTSGMSYIT